MARAAGFDNLSIDLIYGLPGQSLERWREDLSRALVLGSEHISAYGLSLEEGTPLWRAVKQGYLPEPDPDMAADMYLATEDILAAAGYWHYEISNWASEPNPPTPFPEKEGGLATGQRRVEEWRGSPRLLTCRHNLVYWRNEPYLGLGSGAHSSLGGRRFARLTSPAAYVSASPADRVHFVEEIGPALEMAETAILGLRLTAGLERERFCRRFSVDPADHYRQPLAWAQSQGLLRIDADAIRLTRRGRLLSNEVFQRLLPG